MAVGVINCKIKFRLGQRHLTLDYRKVPFQAWGELKQATTFTQRTLVNALSDFDLDAITALIWLERKQRERRLRYLDVYQELQSATSDEEYELIDLVINGKSTAGEPTDEDEPEDPTAGS